MSTELLGWLLWHEGQRSFPQEGENLPQRREEALQPCAWLCRLSNEQLWRALFQVRAQARVTNLAKE